MQNLSIKIVRILLSAYVPCVCGRIFVILQTKFSIQTELSIHSCGSDELPPGVAKYLCEGGECDYRSPDPSFPADSHLG